MDRYKKIKLSPRLMACAELVEQGARLADVGTDHAYLPIWLIQNKKVSSPLFACDINPGPLENARTDAEIYGISGEIKFLLTNGLAGLGENDVDTVVIAGMGGETIGEIILGAGWRWSARHSLVLQPMSKQAELCRLLYANGFYIKDERLIKDAGEIYRVLLVKHGKTELPSNIELYAGKAKNEAVMREYLDKLIKKFERAKSGIENSENRNERQIAELSSLIEAAEARKKELDEK